MKNLIFVIFILISCQKNFTLEESDLPVLEINTPSHSKIYNEPKLEARLNVYLANFWKFRNNYISENIGIELRGQSSLKNPKKGYGFEFRELNGKDKAVNLFHFPEESDWVLNGPYKDKSLVKNLIIYRTWKEISKFENNFSPDVLPVNLVINEDYQGIYLLIEKIKISKNRLNISKNTINESNDNKFEIGFVLGFDVPNSNKFETFTTSHMDENNLKTSVSRIMFKEPSIELLTNTQREQIQNLVESMESSLVKIDSEGLNNLEEWIDINSFIDFILAQELSKEVDSYRRSTFFYWDPNIQKFKAGPIWDFNATFGIEFGGCNTKSVSGWLLNNGEECGDKVLLINYWWPKLFNNLEFKKRIQSRWNNLKAGPLSRAHYENTINGSFNDISNSVELNFQRWAMEDEIDKYPIIKDKLKVWALARWDWMDKTINQF